MTAGNVRVVRRGLHPNLILLVVVVTGAPSTERALRLDTTQRRQNPVPDPWKPAEAHGRHRRACLVVCRLEWDVLRQLRLPYPLIRLPEVAEDPWVALCPQHTA